MRIKLLIINILFLAISHFSLNAQQVLIGKDAQSIIKGAEMLKIDDGKSIPSYIRFSKGNEIPFSNLDIFLLAFTNNDKNFHYKLINQTEDQFKNIHFRYLLTYKGIAIQNAMFIVHVKNLMIYAINGNIPGKINTENNINITSEAALQYALKHINAERYKWQIPSEEALLKRETNDINASYYPKGEMVLYQKQGETTYNYAYCFDIYAVKPLKRADFYIDASNGNLLYENNKIHLIDSLGSAITKFSGTQSITTNYTGTNFTLREGGRGLGIETYNMLTGTNYANATDFTDNDNLWNNVNTQKDEVATDAHWAAEKTWDYYWHKFKRNSIDGQGFKLKSYVHFDVNYANAFWDGQQMTFGDGNSTWQPLVALDISGHEITHGLTSFTANLDYSYESGALNESYSDIFATAIEFYAKPLQANWLIGENIGTAIRSMSNPNTYNQPDTYLGNMWFTGSGDNGGVHTNSGVLNYWFYLLSIGGSGTNDNGNAFNITGISIDSAAAIAFRTLTVYLTNTSNYADARFYSIMSATELFGSCSPKVQNTTNAFYAVGVGNAYIPGVQGNFSADNVNFCQPPATVNFTNQSNNGGTYTWDFGDGTSSNLLSPTHTYTALGTYNVKLIANGGSCGIDSLIKTNYISISTSNPCIINMPVAGFNSITACNGTIYDNGGSNNYSDNSISTTIIKADGAASISLNFSSFSLESGYDYLYIYDGASTTSPLIGTYTGTSIPTSITSTSNRLMLLMTTDEGANQSGFVASWSCNMPTTPPVCNFLVSDSVSCEGNINFTDNSLNGATNWLWDFGDGNTSTLQDPSHYYNSNGVYNVKLIVSNIIGYDSIIKNSIITINKPADPIKPNDTSSCGPASFTFASNGNGIKWYELINATIPFDTGTIITTPVYNSTTTLYIEREVKGGSLFGGKTDNTGGGSYFNSANQHFLVFNCTTQTLLKSVKVYAAAAGSRTIQLQNSAGDILATKTVNIPNGTSRVTLNFNIPVGTDLKLAGPLNPNLYRNNGGCSYPYQIGNTIKITRSSATQNTTNYYYFFYDWEIEDEACYSNRLPIHITINSAKPIPAFTYSSNNMDFNFSNQTIDGNTYLWDFGDGSTSALTNPTHIYSTYGSYNVKLISYNSCGIDSITNTIDLIAGIQDNNDQNAIRIYPNPTTDKVNISFDNLTNQHASIVLADMIGKTIINKEIDIESNKFNYILTINSLNSGIYLIQIKLKNNIITKKLTIK